MRVAGRTHPAGQRDLTRLLDTAARVAAGEPEDREGSIEALLLNGHGLEDPSYHGHHVRADAFSPRPDPFTVPFAVSLALRLVGVTGPVLVHDVLAKQQMTGEALTAAIHLQH